MFSSPRHGKWSQRRGLSQCTVPPQKDLKLAFESMRVNPKSYLFVPYLKREAERECCCSAETGACDNFLGRGKAGSLIPSIGRLGTSQSVPMQRKLVSFQFVTFRTAILTVDGQLKRNGDTYRNARESTSEHVMPERVIRGKRLIALMEKTIH